MKIVASQTNLLSAFPMNALVDYDHRCGESDWQMTRGQRLSGLVVQFPGTRAVLSSDRLFQSPAHPLLATLNRYVFLWIDWSQVISTRSNQSVVVELFDNVRGPSTDSRYGEDRSEQIHVDPQRVIRRS